jgi:hypothetical protein
MPLRTLIVVCCHAIYIGSSTSNPRAGEDEKKEWIIEAFQQGETPTFIQHIHAGISKLRDCLDEGDNAILVFSGGATKQHKDCSKSEAQGYLVSLTRTGRLLIVPCRSKASATFSKTNS